MDKDMLLAVKATLFTGTGSQNNRAMIMLAYDDVYSIQYFGQNLQAWWKKNFNSMEELLQTSSQQYSNIISTCDAFDKQLYAGCDKGRR
jgi:hypothetical protein